MAIEPIAQTLKTILEDISLPKKNKQQLICDSLNLLLDKKERRHVNPWDLRGEVLILHVDSPGWMYALNLKRQQLLEGLREKLGKDVIKDIRFRIGKVE